MLSVLFLLQLSIRNGRSRWKECFGTARQDQKVAGPSSLPLTGDVAAPASVFAKELAGN